MRSERLFEIAKRLIPGGVNSPVRAFDPYPFFVDETEGSKIRDVDGNEYIDYCLGYGPLILGHNPPPVFDAVRRELEKGLQSGIPSNAEIELAKKIVSHVPCAEMVRFTNSGTEATMNAIRLARAYTGREKVLMFDGAYHGGHDHVLFDSKGAKSPGLPETLLDSTLVAPFNDLEATKELIDGEDLAAIIVEPVMGNAGCIPPREGFLNGLREICNDVDAVLIFDEVITGFRLSMGGAQEFFGVKPDLVTLGKIIGGGFPIGAFAGRENILREVKPEGEVFHAGTFSGHPVIMSAGLATLESLESENVLEEASEFAEKLFDFLRKKLDYSVNQAGPMFQIFFTRDEVESAEEVRESNGEKYKSFHRGLMNEGVFLPPAKFECCFTSGAHSPEDLSLTKKAIERIANEVE
ncbi:glutamate-1-semialdehyde aminotransferase [candidate division MSBL1 archaeon SCGC-AAA382F02]|uniref:Glutamate-1-semialdehyde 2,1-aminomutase n=1 Tax=candidate division MSBL1 archaeon SCGC-AAA382F02 TaxID=1698282 RepID=A0A133VIZ6_9EURY|nr:glutamate-1-semialdehyde aminotransferase [candidate division MSBL1 archaeon SCGC-AAA382F02]